MLLSLFIVLQGCVLYSLLKPPVNIEEKETEHHYYVTTPVSVTNEARKNA